jgi:hypothetical protein
MAANIHWNDLLILNDELEGDAAADIDGNRMQLSQGSLQPVQPQGGVKRVQLEQLA